MSQIPETAPRYVSVVNEFPEDLYEAMCGFVRSHPSWDQYRLMQVALAGFLFQQGSRDRAVARHYLDGLFDRGAVADAGGTLQRPAVPAEMSEATARAALIRPLGTSAAAHPPLTPTRAAHRPSWRSELE